MVVARPSLTIWFVLREGRYDRLPTDDGHRYRSEAFPGLWLDVRAMIRGDLSAVLAVLHEGLKTAEHAAFVASLPRHENFGTAPGD